MSAGQKTGGRPPGALNKRTRNVKAALERAFERMGGVRALCAWGRDNQTEFYKLWAKLLPRDLNITMESGEIGADVRTRLDEVDGEGLGLPGEAGGSDVGDVADAASSSAD
mgnify:CR=1 FL=1